MSRIKTCQRCGESIRRSITVEGIRRSLVNRRHCLKCVPFGSKLKYPPKRRSFIWDIEPTTFKSIIDDSTSWYVVLKKLGLSKMSSLKPARTRCKENSISTKHLSIPKTPNFSKRPLSEILVEESTYSGTNNLKKRLWEEGLLEKKCAICGLGSTWNNKPLVLQLDHINGVRRDNRIENLRILCPNCHTQTHTYAGKANKKVYCCKGCNVIGSGKGQTGFCSSCVNKQRREGKINLESRKVKERPNLEELYSLVEKHSYLEIGRMYGVSDNAIRKWFKSYGAAPPKKPAKPKKVCSRCKVGTLSDKNISGVCWGCKKSDPRPGARKYSRPSYEELCSLREEMSLEEMSSLLGPCVGALKNWFSEYESLSEN